jgi:peptide/nickel transport system permease protein
MSAFFREVLWQRLKRNRMAMAGALIVLTMFCFAMIAPVSGRDPGAIDIALRLQSPSFDYPLGTDDLGRDVLARILYGARISLLVGFVAVGIATFIGILLGAMAGFYGRWVDSLIMRFVDIMLCFPSFFLILAVIAFLEPSIWNIMIIIGLTSWMGVARLVRAEFLSLRERDFVLAARAIGARDTRIIFRHILPNAISPVLVSATLGVAGAILTESALSFLGIGVQPPTPSWGLMLNETRGIIEFAPWTGVFPGLAIGLAVIGFNLFGDGLRDFFDPKMKQ